MRLFELQAGELVDKDIRVVTIDLDRIEMLAERQHYGALSWVVYLASRDIAVTKAGFDRVMNAWKPK